MLSVHLDNRIRFNKSDLDSDTLGIILGYLTIKNPAKARAESELLWRAEDLPEHINLWGEEDDQIVIPRGFVHEFEHILGEKYIQIDWNTKFVRGWFPYIGRFELRDYQQAALENLTHYANGIYKAPTGSGKTRVMLSVVSDCSQKTIVIIEKKDLVSQWKKAAEELGFQSIGIIGGGKFEDDASLVLATRQSLWNCRDKLSQTGWYNKWGMVIVDECHHCSSETMWDLVQRFPAYYRFGCSATPDSDPEVFPIAKAVIGPVVHDTPPDKAQEALVIPSVRVVDTDFEFDYRPTQSVLIKGKTKITRNNYVKMMDALENDARRNWDIIGWAIGEAGIDRSKCLILSKRKGHLDNLQNCLNEHFQWDGDYPFLVLSLTGDNSGESEKISEEISNYDGGCILFSTLAEEGTDIPNLDRLFLAYPGRKVRGFEQAIGRIMRKHPKKRDAIIYDFRDPKVPLLRSQFRTRSQMIYGKRHYDVEFMSKYVCKCRE